LAQVLKWSGSDVVRKTILIQPEIRIGDKWRSR
jgi:hypothetical protein